MAHCEATFHHSLIVIVMPYAHELCLAKFDHGTLIVGNTGIETNC